MPLPVYIISSPSLERWDARTPWTTGIGGSETSHIEMVGLLERQECLEVKSYVPLKSDSESRLNWFASEDANIFDDSHPGVVINYRDPKLFDNDKPANQKWWFIAQDVDYPGLWNETNLARVDRYICLCRTHAEYTKQRYPNLDGRIYISSNGVRSSYLNGNVYSSGQEINHADFDDYLFLGTGIERVPYRMLYASSPDRGLKLLLENWFRIRERFPKATLNIAYGFNNMDTIIKAFGPEDGRANLRAQLVDLFDQEGVTWLGRLNQRELYEQWFQASVWTHPTDWPETNCITCMDAMACGAIPCTNEYWAVGEYVKRGYMVDGVPQKSELIKSLWLNNLYKALSDTEFDREEMMAWARKNFDWNRFVNQWLIWLMEDGEALNG